MDGAPAPAILAVAPNGARRQHSDHPALPLTPPALAECAENCLAAGAAMLHLHVRDDQGQHSLVPAHYREAIRAIRRRVGDQLIVQVTTEAMDRFSAQEQIALVRELAPEAASVALRELCPDDTALPHCAEFYGWCRANGVQLQHIVYHADEVRRLCELMHLGAIPEPQPAVLFVLGRHGQSGEEPAHLAGLLPFLAAWENRGPWMVCAFGAQEHATAIAALALGGHARVGFENNLHLSDGRLAPDNAALIRQLAQALPLAGRLAADAREAREILGGPR